MPERRRPGLWKMLVAAAQTAIDRLADGVEGLADGLRSLGRARTPPARLDDRLAGVDPSLAAYVAARDPEWFSLEVTDEQTDASPPGVRSAALPDPAPGWAAKPQPERPDAIPAARVTFSRPDRDAEPAAAAAASLARPETGEMPSQTRSDQPRSVAERAQREEATPREAPAPRRVSFRGARPDADAVPPDRAAGASSRSGEQVGDLQASPSSPAFGAPSVTGPTARAFETVTSSWDFGLRSETERRARGFEAVPQTGGSSRSSEIGAELRGSAVVASSPVSTHGSSTGDVWEASPFPARLDGQHAAEPLRGGIRTPFPGTRETPPVPPQRTPETTVPWPELPPSSLSEPTAESANGLAWRAGSSRDVLADEQRSR